MKNWVQIIAWILITAEPNVAWPTSFARVFYLSSSILYNYASASCFNMPTEINHMWLSSDCWKVGFPDKSTCPYQHPFLHQNLKQVVPFAGRSSGTVLCQSTKVCCSNGAEGTLPENKERLLEMLQLRETELVDVGVDGGLSMVVQEQKRLQIQEIKTILETPPLLIPEPKGLSSGDIFVLILWVTAILLIISWFVVCCFD